MNKKKSNKKIYIIFIAVMVALYGIGYLTGKLLAKGSTYKSICSCNDRFSHLFPTASLMT